MAPHVCTVVPPYLLSALAASEHNSEDIRKSAHNCLDFSSKYVSKRQRVFAELTAPRGLRGAPKHQPKQRIIPDTLLKHISECEDVDEDTRQRAKHDLEHSQKVQAKYQQAQGIAAQAKAATAAADDTPAESESTYRAVYDAKNTEDEGDLPGTVLRVEGQKAVSDEAANQVSPILPLSPLTC